MTVFPKNEDAVSVSSFQWGLIGRRLLSVMSRGDPPRWPESSATTPNPQGPFYKGDFETALQQPPNSKKVWGEGASIEDSFDESRERRKLKNEDSSYDSDFESCEPPASPRPDDGHEEVSRTASETLAAEFEEYITLDPRGGQPPPTAAVTPTRSAITVLSPSSAGTRTSAAQGALLSTTPILTLTEATPQPCLLAPAYPSGAGSPLSQVSSNRFPASSTGESISKASPATSSSKIPLSGSVSAPLWAPPGASVATPDTDGSVHSLDTVVTAPEYPHQVEFGVKLGYSESLVQLALTKLGTNPDKNELLDELIRLGAGAPRTDSEGESGEGEDVKEESEAANLLRTIVIDGSSVAMSHGNKTTFSCKGIRLCVDWFRARGHTDIRVFVPKFRKEASKVDAPITDQEILMDLEDVGLLSFTPSRTCSGKRIVAYDDRYIIKEAINTGGVIVSNDNFRDLASESANFKKVIEESILMYSWVNGRFEPPDDPLGRNGPSLDAFLKKSHPAGVSFSAKESRTCPYGRKCTYGNKCKYMHPERGAAPVKSVTERLQEQAQKHFQKSRDSSPGENLRAKSLTLPVSTSESGFSTKKPLSRTQSNVPSVSVQQHISVQQSGAKEDETSSELHLTATPESATSLPPQGSHIHHAQCHMPFSSLRASALKGDLPFQMRSQGAFPVSWQPWNTNQNIEATQTLPTASQNPRFPPLPIGKPLGELEGGTPENPHPKLRRQFSINPTGDSRIPNMSKEFDERTNQYSFLSSMPLSQPPQQQMHQKLFQQQQNQHFLDGDSLNSRSCIPTPRCISPNPNFGYGHRDHLLQPYHPPLTRHSSSQESKQVISSFSHMYSPYYHSNVTRNLSAPDPIWGGGGSTTTSSNLHQPLATALPHKRLSSTSDSRLNIHGTCSDSTQFLSDPFDDSISRISSLSHRSLTGLSSGISAPGPGPIGSRPLSPQQPLSSVLHPSPLPSRRATVQHPTPSATLGIPSHPIAPASTHEDERLKIFYHLSQLFPEAQVRSALLKNPEETDPTKICASILSAPPQAPVGSRPMSPQQIAGCGVSLCGGLGAHLPLRGSSSLSSLFPSSTSVEAANKESARLEAFSCLTKLFPEDQVHNILRAYPEETDPIKFIMLLVALNKQS